MKNFELFFKTETIGEHLFFHLIEEIFSYENIFFLIINFKERLAEFYILGEKDLSLITGKIKEVVLKPIKEEIKMDDDYFKVKRLKLSESKNILEIKEEEEIKRNIVIDKLVIKAKKFWFLKLFWLTIYFKKDKQKFYSRRFYFSPPVKLLQFDFKNSRFRKKSIPLFLKIDEALPLFSKNEEKAIFSIDGFPYFTEERFFTLDSFEIDRHSLIVGQTGVGKSKLLELLVKKLNLSEKKEEFAVVVIDPHASLLPSLKNLSSFQLFDFLNTSCNLFPQLAEPKIATELTLLLFKTLLKNQYNAKLERMLKYCLYLLFSQKQMNLFNLKKFLTELEFRQEVLKESQAEEYLRQFFETEFIEMETKFYEIAIMPVLVLIDELNFLPVFHKNQGEKLEESLENNFLTLFSLNRIFLGENATRLIAGLLIQQLFLLAQSRKISKKIVLMIDEVSVVENEGLISILSEARKFGLSLFLYQQYLTQISPSLLKAILSNVYNYFIFKVSDEDAQILSRNLLINFPDELIKSAKEKGIGEEDLKKRLLVSLNPREAVIRPYKSGKFYPCFKGKTLSV